MITINYLGNEFVPQDSLAIVLADELKDKFKRKVKFQKIDTFDGLMNFKGKYYFMDVCVGISKARIINDVAVFENIRAVTSHDVDFGFFMQLSHQLGEINKINIICLPQSRYENIIKDVTDLINNLIEESKDDEK